MRIDIISIFPEMFDKIFDSGIIKQAIKNRKLEIKIHNLRDHATGRYKQVDDRPYGGGVGMVLMIEPLANVIERIKADCHPELVSGSISKEIPDTPQWAGRRVRDDEMVKVIYLSPKGKRLTQEVAENLSKESHLILVCGRYEGVDQRFIDNFVDEEISIGDYVLSGGEIPAMVLVDAVTRLIPGAIKNVDFNKSESFSNPENRSELDYPQYTRPEDFKGLKVPKVLLSGSHKEIEKWRKIKQT